MRNFYTEFVSGHKYFLLTKLPMGGVISVFISQVYLSAAMQQLVNPGLTYIDSWIFHGDVRQTVTNITEHFQASLSENNHDTTVDYLGLNLNARNRSIRLADSFKKHTALLSSIRNGEFTNLELWRVFGIIWRYIEVSQRPLADAYNAMSLMRRIARAIATETDRWHEKANIPEKVREELETLGNEAMTLSEFQVDNRNLFSLDNYHIIFTDASLKGIGFVHIFNGRVNVGARTISVHEAGMAIHELEAIAGIWGLEEAIPIKARFMILIDNAVVCHGLQKSYSPIPWSTN